MYELRGISGA
jgi:hypothetical protein